MNKHQRQDVMKKWLKRSRTKKVRCLGCDFKVEKPRPVYLYSEHSVGSSNFCIDCLVRNKFYCAKHSEMHALFEDEASVCHSCLDRAMLMLNTLDKKEIKRRIAKDFSKEEMRELYKVSKKISLKKITKIQALTFIYLTIKISDSKFDYLGDDVVFVQRKSVLNRLSELPLTWLRLVEDWQGNNSKP